MTRHLLLAALCAVIPALAVAQDTTAPTVLTESPSLSSPPNALPINSGVAPTPSPDLAPGAPPLTVQNQPAETALATPQTSLPVEENLADTVQDASAKAAEFLKTGGPSIWAIAALSVVTLTLIIWKIWRLALIGAWSRGKAGRAVDLFEAGDSGQALAMVERRRGIRSIVVANAIQAIRNLPEDQAREETARVAKREIAQASIGLRALELIATIAPLLGLLGTVLGMIAAFQALQQAGNRADPALLAGGIWEALLTTAAGMAVAIPASAALTWFEAVIDRIRRDAEDSATRLFVSEKRETVRLAAE
ncbi:MAG: MotA/TolQ/ExbB proton channel family protein [Pseudomonadota bacterium]